MPKHFEARSHWIAVALALLVAGGCQLRAFRFHENYNHNWLAALHSTDESIRMDAAYAMEGIGSNKKDLVLLTAALKDSDPYVRRYVASALGELATEPSLTVPALIQALRDEDQAVRERATISLAKIGSPAAPALIEALKTVEVVTHRSNHEQHPRLTYPGVDVAYYAGVALSEIGPPAIPALLKALGDQHVGRSALFILRRIGKPAVPALARALRDGKPNVRSLAMEVLASVGPDAEVAAPILVQILKDDNPKLRLLTAKALVKISPDAHFAVSALREILKGKDGSLRKEAADVLGSIRPEGISALVDALKSKNDEIRAFASAALAVSWRPQLPEGAIAGLMQALGDSNPEVRANAARALGWIDPETVVIGRALAKALRDPEPSVRQAAAYALRGIAPSIGKEMAVIIPMLIEALKVSDKEVRKGVVSTLEYIGKESRAAIPPLIEALRDSDKEVRVEAAGALGRIGKKAHAAVPSLIQLLKDSDVEVRRSVVYALGQTSVRNEAVVAAFSKALLTDPSWEIRYSITSELGELGAGAEAALPALIKTLKRADEEHVRRNAAVALTKIGRRGVSALFQVMKDKNEELRIFAVSALGKSSPYDDRIIPALIQSLNDPSRSVRRDAANSLAERGPNAELAVPALSEVLNDPDVGESSLYALKRIGSGAIPALMKATESQDDKLRAGAIGALGDIESKDNRIVVALTRALKDSSQEVRLTAIEGIGEIGPQAKAGLPELVQLLSDPSPKVRASALFTLARFGPAPQDAIPALILLLTDTDAEVRGRAASYLGQVGRGVKDITVGLLRALKDKNANVRIAAAEALVNIDIDPKEAPPRLITVITDDYINRYMTHLALEIGIGTRRENDIVTEEMPEPEGLRLRTPNMSYPAYAPRAQAAQLPRFGPPIAYESLPTFPWPPPRFSAWDVLPQELLGTDKLSLRDVNTRLSAGLEATGFEENGLFGVPGGFALVTKVERIREDGTSFLANRWSKGKVRPLSLIDYLGQLFLEKPGQFRLIAFIIRTLDNFQSSSEKLSEEEAFKLFMEGGRVLPDSIGNLPFEGRKCHALIYHFEKRRGGAIVRYPSPLGAKEHLRKVGIWTRLASLTSS